MKLPAVKPSIAAVIPTYLKSFSDKSITKTTLLKLLLGGSCFGSDRS